MTKLSASQIYTLLLDGGFSPSQAKTMTAIAQAESARNPGAIGDVGLEDHKWGPSVGLFQIRTLKSETGTGSDRDIQHLLNNPAAQVRAALDISNKGHNFHPWSTYTSGSYLKFLDTPLQAGVSVPMPVGGADPFQIDSGVQPSSAVDSDRDGLTDQFEALLGTNPNAADSDHDGLSDAYETSVSHTDPLSADTDHDGLSDSYELAHGTDPGHVPVPAAAAAAGFGGLETQDSDHDGLSDAFEKAHGTDPLSADSDHDGLSDAQELAKGLNPLSADSNNDGITDGFAANHDLLPAGPAGAGSPLTPGLGSGLGGGLGAGTGWTDALDPGGSDWGSGMGVGNGLEGTGMGNGLGAGTGMDPSDLYPDPAEDPSAVDHH